MLSAKQTKLMQQINSEEEKAIKAFKNENYIQAIEHSKNRVTAILKFKRQNKQVQGDFDLAITVCRHRIAQSYMALGQYDKGVEVYKQCMDDGNDEAQTVKCNLAVFYLEQGRYNDALNILKKVKRYPLALATCATGLVKIFELAKIPQALTLAESKATEALRALQVEKCSSQARSDAEEKIWMAFSSVYHFRGDFDKSNNALRFLLKKLPSAHAKFTYAVRLDSGTGIEQNKLLAVKIYRENAELGHTLSQYYLAESLYAGDGVPIDKIEADVWFKKAFEQGHVDAGRHIAEEFRDNKQYKAAANIYYRLVTEFKSDPDKVNYAAMVGGDPSAFTDEELQRALKYTEERALKGDSDAQQTLGNYYSSGFLVDINLERSIHYLEKALASKTDPKDPKRFHALVNLIVVYKTVLESLHPSNNRYLELLQHLLRVMQEITKTDIDVEKEAKFVVFNDPKNCKDITLEDIEKFIESNSRMFATLNKRVRGITFGRSNPFDAAARILELIQNSLNLNAMNVATSMRNLGRLFKSIKSPQALIDKYWDNFLTLIKYTTSLVDSLSLKGAASVLHGLSVMPIAVSQAEFNKCVFLVLTKLNDRLTHEKHDENFAKNLTIGVYAMARLKLKWSDVVEQVPLLQQTIYQSVAELSFADCSTMIYAYALFHANGGFQKPDEYWINLDTLYQRCAKLAAEKQENMPAIHQLQLATRYFSDPIGDDETQTIIPQTPSFQQLCKLKIPSNPHTSRLQQRVVKCLQAHFNNVKEEVDVNGLPVDIMIGQVIIQVDGPTHYRFTPGGERFARSKEACHDHLLKKYDVIHISYEQIDARNDEELAYYLQNRIQRRDLRAEKGSSNENSIVLPSPGPNMLDR